MSSSRQNIIAFCFAALAPMLTDGGCKKAGPAAAGAAPQQHDRAGNPMSAHAGEYVGFDRNLYPGGDRLQELHQHFAYVGYWLNTPPGAPAGPAADNSWQGKRKALHDAGFGFLILFNGRLERQIDGSEIAPEALGKQDAAAAVAAAQREGFPAGAILFLDQEEGGRLTPSQAGYFFAWTEAVATSPYKPGAYVSGQPAPDGNSPDGKPQTITTAQNVRTIIMGKELHPVALWVAQDICPPSLGCTLSAPALSASGSTDAIAWQYAQSPRRPDRTQACAATYAADNLCYAGVTKDIFLDLNTANSADPSRGR